MRILNVKKKIIVNTCVIFLSGILHAQETLPIIDGLTVWLDASDKNNVMLNEMGQVTNWINRAENGINFVIDTSYAQPFYKEGYVTKEGATPKNIILFGENAEGAVSYTGLSTPNNTTIKSQTIFIVAAIPAEAELLTAQGVAYGLRQYGGVDYGMSRDAQYKYIRWIKNGFGGNGWLNGKKWYDYDNGLGASDSVYATPGANVIHVVTSIRKTPWEGRMSVGHGSRTKQYAWHGPIGEVVVFDRQLTPYERVKVETYLMKKWVDNTTSKTWKAADGEWNVGTNWDPEGVPTNSDDVNIPANSKVSVTDNTAKAKTLTIEGDITLEKNSAVTLSGGGGLGLNGSITLKDGSAILGCEDFSGDLSGNQTFSYEGSVLFNLVSKYGVLKLPSIVNANGKLTKAGPGRLSFIADGPTTGSHDILCGASAIDFAGTHQKFTSLRGSTVATNSVPSVIAQLEMDIDDTQVLDMQLPDELAFVKKGEGVLIANGASLVNKRGVEIAEGTLKASSTISPRAIPGVIFHLDASDESTYKVPIGSNLLTHFWTREGNSVAPRSESGWLLPYLKEDGINGKSVFAFANGAREFGFTSKACNLHVAKTVRTMVAITLVTEECGYSTRPTILGKWANNAPSFGISGVAEYWELENGAAYGENKAHGFCSINGKVIYDYDNGITDTLHPSANVGKPQVVVMTTSESGIITTAEIGINVTGANRAWHGYLGEMILFNRVLTKEERTSLEDYLMKKWGVESEADEAVSVSNTLHPSSPIAFADGTTLDLNGITQRLEKVVAKGEMTVNNGTLAAEEFEVKCTEKGVWGAIDGTANWDTTATTFIFSGLGNGIKPLTGNLVTTTGMCVGPVAGVDGNNNITVKVKEHTIQIGEVGLMLIVR